MKIGLVGLPGSGKTTCFRVLTGHAVPDTHHGARVATVPLPDPRLDRIAELCKPRKRTYADVTFVDFDALHRGQAQEGELGLQKVAGGVDAFALILQCFGTLDARGEPLDPVSDLETVLLEMALSDLRIIEKHLEALEKGPKAERTAQRMELMHRCRDHLSAGKALRTLNLHDEELKVLRGFAPLTLMPLLVVCNTAEDGSRDAQAAAVADAAKGQGLPEISLCAELEEEIAQLPEEEQASFLANYGLEKPARQRFLQACFELLDLIVFFTVNESEARAWTVRRGATAPEAAGRVHSDLQRGFIRAEVTPFTWLDKIGTLQACKEKGYQRIEGKDYVVQDGDILQIRFSR